MDWRVKTIFGIVGVAILATGFFYFQSWGVDPATHFGAVFASWVGGLALFVITGIVVALISLARPEHESFDARARILFRRQAGKHIDYIVTKIQEVLEHYAESTDIKVTITGYDETDKKFRISSTMDAVVRSYIDDVESTYISSASLADVTAPPQGGQPNRIVYVRVDGTPVGVSEDFTDAITRPISCRIDRDGTCPVSTRTEYWVRADDEPNRHRARRYTQSLRLHLENLLPAPEAIKVKFTLDGTNWVEEQLTHGATKQLAEVKDLKPGVVAYEYRILGP